jgi:hypothetical protein
MAVSAQTFPFSRNFVDLKEEDIAQAITDMSVQYSGTQEMWANLDSTLQQQKRDLVLSLIVAWHLADMFPEKTEGVVVNGGMPLSGKESGGVILKFLPVKVQESMYPFLTNTFGIRALSMIMSAPERFALRGDRGLYAPPLPTGYNGSLV